MIVKYLTLDFNRDCHFLIIKIKIIEYLFKYYLDFIELDIKLKTRATKNERLEKTKTLKSLFNCSLRIP